MDNTLEIPKGLSPTGEAVAKSLSKFAKDGNLSTGGCKAFYSPKEWAERGERYGLDAELIICHDGGDFAPFFNMDYCEYKAYDSMMNLLAKDGAWMEGCTTWYSAIYKN